MSAVLDEPRTEVATAASAALDLTKVDLTDVALAKFGPWREKLADAKKNIDTLALDLTIQARIDDAKSLRHRLFGQPLADIRKVSKGLKSKLSQVSKAVGAEETAAEAEFAEAEKPLTEQIDTAQKKIDDAKEAAREAEEKRLKGLRDTVDAIMLKWLTRCGAEGMTAERMGAGIAALEALPMPTELADAAKHWDLVRLATLVEMVKLKQQATDREQAERQRQLDEQAEKLAREKAELEAKQRTAATPATEAPAPDTSASAVSSPTEEKGTEVTPGPSQPEASPPTLEQFKNEHRQIVIDAGRVVKDSHPNEPLPESIAGLIEAAAAANDAPNPSAQQEAGQAPAQATEAKASPCQAETSLPLQGVRVPGSEWKVYGGGLKDYTTVRGAIGVAFPDEALAIETDISDLAVDDHATDYGDFEQAAQDLTDHIALAAASKFPSQPKLDAVWWTGLYEKARALKAILDDEI